MAPESAVSVTEALGPAALELAPERAVPVTEALGRAALELGAPERVVPEWVEREPAAVWPLPA